MKHSPQKHGSLAVPLTCPALSQVKGVQHGFFGRNGGVSSGLYRSLNCGYGSGDDIASVAQNRALVAGALHVEAAALCTAYQIHSANVVPIQHPWHWSDAPQADAIVTNEPGIALGILTADCVPVLFADGEHYVIAAAHAGWKGAFGGVIENTLDAMLTLGAKRESIIATIGPAIAQGSYEVGAEFHDRFIKQDSANSLYFIHGARPEHYLFDLKAYVKDRLRNAEISQVHMLSNDTCAQEEDFFSFRRATLRGESVYGRQFSAITLSS